MKNIALISAVQFAIRYINELGASVRAGRNLSMLFSDNWPTDPAATVGNFQSVKRIYERHGVSMDAPKPMPKVAKLDARLQPTSVSECRTLARAELKAARSLLSREISTYPTPVAGCDCQFNYLLDERRRVTAAINLLENEPRHLP